MMSQCERRAHTLITVYTGMGAFIEITLGEMYKSGWVARDMPPLNPISFIFMQFLTKILPNNRFLFQIQVLVSPIWETLNLPLQVVW